MVAAPSLKRRRRNAGGVSLVPMIDVLMIFLVFFMVTSRYLDLDMIPLAAGDTGDAAQQPTGTPLLLRLTGDGTPMHAGQSLTPAALSALVARHLAGNPGASVLVLPSPFASTQALVSLMDGAAEAGAKTVQLIRLAEP